LRRRVREPNEDLIDFEPWERQVALQEVELKCIADFAHKVKNLPQLRPTSFSPPFCAEGAVK
jgi:hypothetical protein